jgi:hypothetical protein
VDLPSPTFPRRRTTSSDHPRPPERLRGEAGEHHHPRRPLSCHADGLVLGKEDRAGPAQHSKRRRPSGKHAYVAGTKTMGHASMFMLMPNAGPANHRVWHRLSNTIESRRAETKRVLANRSIRVTSLVGVPGLRVDMRFSGGVPGCQPRRAATAVVLDACALRIADASAPNGNRHVKRPRHRLLDGGSRRWDLLDALPQDHDEQGDDDAPPGECRIWFPDRPPGHQPPPGRC